MKTNNDAIKMEFLLMLNDNIVIQRYFNVNDFNPDSLRSLELNDAMIDVARIIELDLKNKTSDFMINNSQLFFSDNYKEQQKTDKDIFTLTLKKDNKTIIERYINAMDYPPKIRYTVDIRKKVRYILKKFTDILSQTEVTTTYLDYQL